jgi:hypothetical protein
MNHGGKREGSGRKPIVENGVVIPVLVPMAVADLIPVPKASWIRGIVVKEVRRDYTYEQLIDKANACIQAAVACWNAQLVTKPIGAYMGDVWYEKAKELRASARMLPCDSVPE